MGNLNARNILDTFIKRTLRDHLLNSYGGLEDVQMDDGETYLCLRCHLKPSFNILKPMDLQIFISEKGNGSYFFYLSINNIKVRDRTKYYIDKINNALYNKGIGVAKIIENKTLQVFKISEENYRPYSEYQVALDMEKDFLYLYLSDDISAISLDM